MTNLKHRTWITHENLVKSLPASSIYVEWNIPDSCLTIWGPSEYKDVAGSYQYRDPHVKDKMASRPSYLEHGNPHTCERRSLYWGPDPTRLYFINWDSYGSNIPDSKAHGANMGPIWGPTGPRWAPCWPHELCYLGCFHHTGALQGCWVTKSTYDPFVIFDVIQI